MESSPHNHAPTPQALPWLLVEDNPSVRYQTLTDLLGKPENDPEVVQTRQAIMARGHVPRILSHQEEGGYWGKPGSFYMSSKYVGTVWSFQILAALGANGADERIRKACEFVLQWSQHRESGGFAIRRRSNGGNADHGGDGNSIEPCLTGNMIWSLLKFGYIDDPRVQRGIDWIVRYQRFDDHADTPPTGWPYDGWEMCWGRRTCNSAIVKPLMALAEIPPERRTPQVNSIIEQAIEFFLQRRIFKKSRNLSEISIPAWTQFGFPRFWETDVLEIVDVLTALGYKDSRMQEAIDLIESRQDVDGRWPLESTWNGRTLARIDQKGKPSKWITLRALRALKRYYS